MVTSQRSAAHDGFVLEIDEQQKEYPIQELSPEFVAWNLGQRTMVLKKMLAAIGNPEPPAKGGGGFGSHLPVFITNNPEGNLFAANAANKGTGFVAKDEYLDYYLQKFKDVAERTNVPQDASAQEKDEAARLRIETILEFYENTDKIDLRCLAGLQIWPGNTSKNLELDPRVSLHFLGMPSSHGSVRYNQWQVNCIWEKIEAGDKRFEFGAALRHLTMGHVGRSFVPGHIPTEQTPIKGQYPHGWILWVVETQDKGIDALPS